MKNGVIQILALILVVAFHLSDSILDFTSNVLNRQILELREKNSYYENIIKEMEEELSVFNDKFQNKMLELKIENNN